MTHVTVGEKGQGTIENSVGSVWTSFLFLKDILLLFPEVSSVLSAWCGVLDFLNCCSDSHTFRVIYVPDPPTHSVVCCHL